jgi:hypothetical protein
MDIFMLFCMELENKELRICMSEGVSEWMQFLPEAYLKFWSVYLEEDEDPARSEKYKVICYHLLYS